MLKKSLTKLRLLAEHTQILKKRFRQIAEGQRAGGALLDYAKNTQQFFRLLDEFAI